MLRLSALDAEDLAVISAHMQDAVLPRSGMRYDPKRRQFALLASRFAWEADGRPQRRRAGLHFDRVLAVRTRGLAGLPADAPLSLLSITFAETDAPSGEVLLSFSGGATLRLAVECLEAQLADLGPAWAARSVPSHPLGEDDAG